jgi:uncharacterized protein (DUF169 family)
LVCVVKDDHGTDAFGVDLSEKSVLETSNEGGIVASGLSTDSEGNFATQVAARERRFLDVADAETHFREAGEQAVHEGRFPRTRRGYEGRAFAPIDRAQERVDLLVVVVGAKMLVRTEFASEGGRVKAESASQVEWFFLANHR